MKIAQVVCTSPPYAGGIGNSAHTFGELLSATHTVTTFSPEYKKGENIETSSDHFVVKIPALIKYGNAAFVPRLLRHLKNYDVIYLHYPFFGGAEVIWLYKFFIQPQKKLVIHYHMDVFKLSLPAKILSFPSRLIFNSLFKKADLITIASPDYIEHSQLKKIYSRFPEKFREIPFGVNTEEFTPSSSKNYTPRLLLVGGLDKAHYFKGVDVLLSALASLKEKKWQMDIIGEGDMKETYKKQAGELGLEKRVNFPGKLSQEKLRETYRQSDIFLLPSKDKSEAFGIVLLEAMATGLPVVASKLPGVRGVFQHQKQGLLVAPTNPEDLARKISYLLDHPDRRKEMGKKARQLIEEKYSLQKLQNNLISLFL